MSSTLMPVDPWRQFATHGLIDYTTTVTKGEKLTNLDHAADTWGKFIVMSFGNARVQGAQVWSSDFYEVTTRRSFELVDDYQEKKKTVSPWDQMWLDASLVLHGGNVNYTNVSSGASIDIAWSFGYNPMKSTRKVSRIRIDGKVIYDTKAAINDPNYLFNIRYGDEEGPEPLMVAADEDPSLTVHYPEQVIITFTNVTQNGNNALLPKNVDIDLTELARSEELEGVRTNFPDSDFVYNLGFDTFQTTWKGDYFYTYARHVGKHGEIRKWQLSTGKRMATVSLDNIPVPDPFHANSMFATMIFSRGLGLFVAQYQNPGNYGAIYLINPDTGAVVFKYGVDGFAGTTTPRGSGYFHQEQITLIKDTETGVTLAGTGLNRATVDVMKISKGDNGYTAVISDYPRSEGAGATPNATARSEDGFTVSVQGSKLYRSSDTEMKMIFDNPKINSGVRDVAVVQEKIFVAYGEGYMLLDKEGKVIYDKIANDDPNKPGNAFGWCNTNETRAFLENRKPGSPWYVVSWNLTHTLKINMLTGAADWTRVRGDTGNTNSPAGGVIYDPDDGKLYQVNAFGSSGNGYVQLESIVEGSRILLRDFMRAVYVTAGVYTADQIQFVEINDMIIGAILAKSYPLSALIQNICQLYQIERVETENSVKFYRNRSIAIAGAVEVAYELSVGDLALMDGGEGERVSLLTSIENPEQLTAEVTLNYIDYEADFAENNVSWRRPDATADSNQTMNISVPIVMTKSEAMRLVQLKFSDEVSASTTHKFKLPPKYSDVTPGDILRIKDGTYYDTMRLTLVDLNGDFSVTCEADNIAMERGSLIEVSDTWSQGNKSPSNGSGDTLLQVFDNLPTTHYSLNPVAGEFVSQYVLWWTDPGWSGGYAARRTVDEEYSKLFEGGRNGGVTVLSTPEVLQGDAWTVAPGPLSVTQVGANPWDAANNVTVTDLLQNSGRNVAIYGAEDRWEIIQFAAIVEGKMTGILRGLRGTEGAVPLHQPGDRIYVLGAHALFERRALRYLGTSDSYKTASRQQVFDKRPPLDRTPKAGSVTPWGPSNIRAARPDTGGPVTISWQRREPGRGAWRTAPNNPDALDKYDVEILDEASGSVVRTFAGVTNARTVNYSAADQAADGRGSAKSLTIRVFQIGTVAGRGFPGKATVHVE